MSYTVPYVDVQQIRTKDIRTGEKYNRPSQQQLGGPLVFKMHIQLISHDDNMQPCQIITRSQFLYENYESYSYISSSDFDLHVSLGRRLLFNLVNV